MHRAIAMLLVSYLVTNFAMAEDWTQFRGPGGQGHSSVKQVPLTWSETENIVWKTSIAGLGWSSPVVKDNKIWVTTSIDRGKSLRVLSFDLASGREIQNVEVFQIKIPGRVHRKNSHASPTPLLEEDRVYVHFGKHGTACLSTSGKIIWKTSLVYDHKHGPGGSPVLFEDLLIINCDGGDVQYMIALDKMTGKTRWKTPRNHISQARLDGDKSPPMGFSTPLLVKVDGVMQVISTGADHVAGYDARTGKEIWWSQYDGYSLVPRPVVGHGIVYVCSGFNKPLVYAIRLGGQGDVTQSHAVWSLTKGAPKSPSPLLVGDEIFIVSDPGIATCLDAKTGKVHYTKRLEGNFSASPLYVAGRIYFLDEKGVTTVIEPGKKFIEIVKNKVQGRTFASLTPLEGAMLLRTDTHLYRIEERKSAE